MEDQCHVYYLKNMTLEPTDEMKFIVSLADKIVKKSMENMF